MLYTLSQGKLLENHTLHSHTYLYSPYMAVPPPPPAGHRTEPLPVCFRIPDRHAKGNPATRARFPGSSQILLPVKTFCVFPNPAPYFSKSRILKVPSRPYIKRLFSPRLQNKKGRKGPPDRSLRRRNVKFKPRIKLNHNMLIPQIC